MENNKSYGTNGTAENIYGAIAVAIVGYLMFYWLYEVFWKHLTYKQKSFFAKYVLVNTLLLTLLFCGIHVLRDDTKLKMDRYDFGGKIYYVPRQEKLHLYPDTYSDTGEKLGE